MYVPYTTLDGRAYTAADGSVLVLLQPDSPTASTEKSAIKIVFEKNLTNKEAILRQLAVLYGTRTGEQALDRNFGLDWSFLDQPAEVAKAMLSAEIITKTNTSVPAVAVSYIDFTTDINGNLTPTVSVEEVEHE